jgi:pimeloyl-ACP methyl ester carboxylesterase
MGGNVALQLGAKYPDLYDGVLDLCGPKDMAFEYADKMYLAGLSDSALQIELNNRGVTTYPLPTLALFKWFCQKLANDTAIECGGTPDSKQKAYERVSPTYSALDVAVPTITLQGNKDSLVPYAESVAYKNAVTAAGHSDLYRLYIVPNAKHGDAALFSQVFQTPYSAFYQLVDWVEDGIPAGPSS